jgi:hypothetical protein
MEGKLHIKLRTELINNWNAKKGVNKTFNLEKFFEENIKNVDNYDEIKYDIVNDLINDLNACLEQSMINSAGMLKPKFYSDTVEFLWKYKNVLIVLRDAKINIEKKEERKKMKSIEFLIGEICKYSPSINKRKAKEILSKYSKEEIDRFIDALNRFGSEEIFNIIKKM